METGDEKEQMGSDEKDLDYNSDSSHEW